MSDESIAYLNGDWVPASHLSISLDDLGFMQGVTAVERMRTWGGRLPLIDAHLNRLEHSTEVLRIKGLAARSTIAELVWDLVDRNFTKHDLGITILVTPGARGGGGPTLCLRAAKLDQGKIGRLRTEGQPLVITPVYQPSPRCWPRDIKVRCRIHYYLADAAAADHHPGALGVLLDEDGSITETSTSNIVLVMEDALVLPPEDRVLPGITARVLCRLAADQQVAIERRPIMPAELRSAPHVWLTGSEAGLWPASEVDGVAKTIDGRIRHWQQILTTYLQTVG